jgi:hypothetical protein
MQQGIILTLVGLSAFTLPASAEKPDVKKKPDVTGILPQRLRLGQPGLLQGGEQLAVLLQGEALQVAHRVVVCHEPGTNGPVLTIATFSTQGAGRGS